MINPSEIEDQLNHNKKLSFREVLTLLINKANKQEISAILLGEIHDQSPTWDAILANLDGRNRHRTPNPD